MKHHPEVVAIREGLIELINNGTKELTTPEMMGRFGLTQQRANLLRRHHWHAFSLDTLLGLAQRINPEVQLRLEVN